MSIAMLFNRHGPNLVSTAAQKPVQSATRRKSDVDQKEDDDGSLLLPWTVLIALSAWPVFIVAAILWVLLSPLMSV